MPGKKNNQQHKKKGGKRTLQSARSNYKLQVQVPALRVRVPYSYQGGITEAAAALGGVISFSINDAFDPEFTGGGLQPLGWDQYCQFYGRYHVRGFKYEITFSTLTAAPIAVGCHLSPQSTLPAVAIAWFVVNETSKSKWLGGSSGSNNVAVISGTADIPRVFGVTKQEYNDMDFQALVTNSPARRAYLHVWTVGRTVTASAVMSVRLWYDVEFSQPVSLSMS